MSEVEFYRIYYLRPKKLIETRLILGYELNDYKKNHSLHEYGVGLWRNRNGTIVAEKIEGGIEDAYISDDYLDNMSDTDCYLIFRKEIRHGKSR